MLPGNSKGNMSLSTSNINNHGACGELAEIKELLDWQLIHTLPFHRSIEPGPASFVEPVIVIVECFLGCR